MTRFLLALACVPLLVSPARAAWPGVAGAQYRYWSFSNDNDLRDVLAYWAPGPMHVQLEYWDFTNREARDQFRPEVGVHLRDRRRSVYTVQWRHQPDEERFFFMTDQVLSKHWVGRAELDPIVSDDATKWVWGLGGDYYWGSYNFFHSTVYRDPRGTDLWVVVLRARLANEANDWLQFSVVPATHRTLGWAIDAKKRWVRVGVERNQRYDFTDQDNVIFTVGVEFRLDAGR